MTKTWLDQCFNGTGNISMENDETRGRPKEALK